MRRLVGALVRGGQAPRSDATFNCLVQDSAATKLRQVAADQSADKAAHSKKMPKYVAFLRAINVGGHTVKMDHLRELFQAMEFSNVETFIASGNVIFEAKSQNTKALENKIELALETALGYKVATFMRTIAELADVAGYRPFHDCDAVGNVLYVGFMADPPGEESKLRLLACTTEVDDFQIYRREVYWLCRKKLGESKFPGGAKLEKTLGMLATLRNSNTVVKIAAKYS